MMLSARRRRGGKAWAWLLAGLLVGGGVGAGAMWVLKRGKDGLPGGPRLGEASELELVPGDAAGFLHVRLRDVWQSEQFASIRQIINKADPDALAALDDGFVPAPTTIDRLTLVFLDKPGLGARPGGAPNPFGGAPPGGGLGLPFDVPTPDLGGTVLIMTFTRPFEAAKFRASAMPDAEQKAVGGWDVWGDVRQDLAAFFPSDAVLVVGPVKPVERFAAKSPKGGARAPGPLVPALTTAAKGGRHLMLGLNVKSFGGFGPDMLTGLPGDFKSLEKDVQALLKTEAVAVGLALGKDEMRLDFRATYATEDDARAAEAAVGPICDMLHKQLEGPKKMLKAQLAGAGEKGKPRPVAELPRAAMTLAGLGALNHLDEYLQKPPVAREGTEVVATFEVTGVGTVLLGGAAVGAALFLPAVDKVRGAAANLTSQNNAKQLGIAMHAYNDVYNRLPSPIGQNFGPADPKKPLLSWRVHLLPFVEQEALYRQFKLDEPWDSPNNKRLVEQMPQIYRSPTAAAEPGRTYYKVFVGGGAPFDPVRRQTIQTIADGSSNTILIVEGGDPVVWTKPDDVPFDPSKPLPDLRLAGNSRIVVAMADGSVRTVDLNVIRPETLKAAITAAGGEVIGGDWDFGQPPRPAPRPGPAPPK